MSIKTLRLMERQEKIKAIERAAHMEAVGFKTDPRNEIAEAIILEFLKSQQWVAQKALEIIRELQEEINKDKE